MKSWLWEGTCLCLGTYVGVIHGHEWLGLIYTWSQGHMGLKLKTTLLVFIEFVQNINNHTNTLKIF
jgi:hypothetical protein